MTEAKPRKIAMVGTARSRAMAPYDDESWEIWGVSGRGDPPSCPRATRWFELHSLRAETTEWVNAWCAELREKVTRDCDLYMIYPREDCGPRVKQYPTERMLARFGSFHNTSSFAWMMAMAIDEMAPPGSFAPSGSTIAIWGVDMEYGTEYTEQRSGFRAYMSIAAALNITVLRPAESGLSYDPVPYPMWQDDPMLCKVDLNWKRVKDQITRSDTDLRKVRTFIAQNRAVLEVLEGMPDAEERIKKLRAETESLMQSSASLSADIASLQGQSEVYGYWRDYLRP